LQIRTSVSIPKASVKSRIILTPEHAKRLMLALQDNVVKYESLHGSIQIHGGQSNLMPMTFSGPAGQA